MAKKVEEPTGKGLEGAVDKRRRLAAYRGGAREIGWLAFNLAIWPIGLVDEAVRSRTYRIRLPSVPFLKKDPTPTPEAAAVPILLLHGYFHNRSGFLVMSRALKRLGFCSVYALNYNPMRRGIPEIADLVACKVDQILERTGAQKLHIVGHSLGGLVARYYVEQIGGHRKVKSVITLGTPHHGTLAAYFSRSKAAKQMRPASELIRTMNSKRKPKLVRYVSYYSDLDALVVPARSAEINVGPNVRNVLVRDLGHMSLLISIHLISSIAAELTGDLDVLDTVDSGEEADELLG